MKISYVNGICVKYDAISNSIRDEICWLQDDEKNEVHLFAYDCCSSEISNTKVQAVQEIVFNSYFQSSELIIFHFGVFYPLFDLLPVCPKNAKILVVFHNITPKKFLPVKNHQTIDKSFEQLANIMFADHVVCVSEVNLQILREAGVQTPATVLSLAVHRKHPFPDSKPSVADGVVRIAFIGRFVRSKGPDELLDAVQRVLQRSESLRLSVDMIGNLTFSDNTLVAEVRQTATQLMKKFGNRVQVSIHGDASNDIKDTVLQEADIFVLPTYHEGLCVPIVEAFASGCRVITYENSNTPFISGGFAELISTGNVEELSCSLLDLINTVLSDKWRANGKESYSEYVERVKRYVQQFLPANTKERFLDFINEFAQISK